MRVRIIDPIKKAEKLKKRVCAYARVDCMIIGYCKRIFLKILFILKTLLQHGGKNVDRKAADKGF